VSRKKSSKKRTRQVKATAELAPTSSWSLFEAGTTALILLMYAGFLTHPTNLTDSDLGRHLKNGEIFIRNGLIAHSNLYSYTQPDYPFINHHWGSGVVFYLVESIAGFQGLSIFNHRDRSATSEQFIVRRVLDPAWAPVFFDRDIIILVKRHGSNHSTIEKHELSKEQVLSKSS
jgi:hypothetical protein